jgi:hypothetical protein
MGDETERIHAVTPGEQTLSVTLEVLFALE